MAALETAFWLAITFGAAATLATHLSRRAARTRKTKGRNDFLGS